MKWIINILLKDSNMRLNSTMITIVVAFSTIWTTISTGTAGWEVLVGLLGVAMGSKAVQKFAEIKELQTLSDNKKAEEAKTEQQPQYQSYPQYPGQGYFYQPPTTVAPPNGYQIPDGVNNKIQGPLV